MNREDDHGQVQYKALVDIERDEFLRVRLGLQDSQERTKGRSNACRFWLMGICGFFYCRLPLLGNRISLVPGHHA